MLNDLPRRAQGRWQQILPLLGIDSRCLVKTHGPCPLCNGGKDRFRFDDKEGRGTWYCSFHGSGDGIRLLELKHGWDFKRTIKEVGGIIGDTHFVAAKAEQSATPTEINERMAKQWLAASPLKAKDPVLTYLASRRIPPKLWRNLRYCPATDSMLALYVDPQGKPSTLHRTPLRGGRKLFFTGAGIAPGGAVRLMGAKQRLGIAEGITTALSASLIHDVPCWAALTADLVTKWEPPNGVEEVWIFGDRDDNFVGQASAYLLARRLASKYKVKVCIPEGHNDWNDVLMASAMRSHAPLRPVAVTSKLAV